VPGCAFWGSCWHCSRFRGPNAPKTGILGAKRGIFKPNMQIIQTFVLSKLLQWFWPNFAQWYRPPSTLCRWSQNLRHNSKMMDGCHLEKNEKSLHHQPFDWFWQSICHMMFLCNNMPYRCLVDTTPHLGSQMSQKTHFGAWIGIFKPNLQPI